MTIRGISLAAAGQSYTDRDIFDSADVQYRTRFMQAQRIEEAMSTDVVPWRDYVRFINPAVAFTDPRSQEIVEIWYESDPRMRLTTGGPPQFEVSKARSRSITRKQYEKAKRESIPNLRQPTIRAAVADEIASWGKSVEFTKREEVWQIILAGDTGTYGRTYDNQFLFDTDHPGVLDGAAVSQSNVFDLAFNETNLDTVIGAAELYVDSFGVSFGNKWRAASMITPQTDRERQTGIVRPSFHIIAGAANKSAVAALANPNGSSKYAGTFTWETNEHLRGAFDGYWLVKFPGGTPLAHVDGGVHIDSKVGPDTEPGRLYNAAEWVLREEHGWTYDEWAKMIMCRN